MCNICVICNNVHCSWWCRSWWWSAVKESRQPSALQNNWGAWGTPKRIIPLLFFICSSLCESDVISRLLSAMRSSIELGKETSVWIHHSRRKAGGRRDENGWRLFVVNARSADRLQNMLKIPHAANKSPPLSEYRWNTTRDKPYTTCPRIHN